MVYFKNNVRYPASMHPHGVLYTKESEGAPYNDGTKGEAQGSRVETKKNDVRSVKVWGFPAEQQRQSARFHRPCCLCVKRIG